MSAERPYVEGLVPFVHVQDVLRSTAFYERFGFEARLMLAQADEPVVASQQAVLFYVYAHELEELHEQLAQAGCEPGPIAPGAPGPDRQFRIDDPDGYCVMVTDAAAIAPPAGRA